MSQAHNLFTLMFGPSIHWQCLCPGDACMFASICRAAFYLHTSTPMYGDSPATVPSVSPMFPEHTSVHAAVWNRGRLHTSHTSWKAWLPSAFRYVMSQATKCLAT